MPIHDIAVLEPRSRAIPGRVVLTEVCSKEVKNMANIKDATIIASFLGGRREDWSSIETTLRRRFAPEVTSCGPSGCTATTADDHVCCSSGGFVDMEDGDAKSEEQAVGPDVHICRVGTPHSHPLAK